MSPGSCLPKVARTAIPGTHLSCQPLAGAGSSSGLPLLGWFGLASQELPLGKSGDPFLPVLPSTCQGQTCLSRPFNNRLFLVDRAT